MQGGRTDGFAVRARPRAAPAGRARDRAAPEEGPPGLARRRRQARDRPELLGPELVPQPRALQRLLEPLAARTHLRPERLRRRSPDRGGPGRGAGVGIVSPRKARAAARRRPRPVAAPGVPRQAATKSGPRMAPTVPPNTTEGDRPAPFERRVDLGGHETSELQGHCAKPIRRQADQATAAATASRRIGQPGPPPRLRRGAPWPGSRAAPAGPSTPARNAALRAAGSGRRRTSSPGPARACRSRPEGVLRPGGCSARQGSPSCSASSWQSRWRDQGLGWPGGSRTRGSSGSDIVAPGPLGLARRRRLGGSSAAGNRSSSDRPVQLTCMDRRDERRQGTARVVGLHADDGSFDREFWRGIPPKERLELVWAMALEARHWRGERGGQPRLQRSVCRIERRGR